MIGEFTKLLNGSGRMTGHQSDKHSPRNPNKRTYGWLNY